MEKPHEPWTLRGGTFSGGGLRGSKKVPLQGNDERRIDSDRPRKILAEREGEPWRLPQLKKETPAEKGAVQKLEQLESRMTSRK
jgi:hypothetical protein